MRFHHSTRRGRHQLAPNSSSHHNPHASSSSRWSQLNHCRETNIYFNRRLPVEYPSVAECSSAAACFRTDTEQEDDPIMVGSLLDKRTLHDNKEELDLDTLREKLIAQVQKHPFWSNKAAKRMQIKNVKRRNVYIYELESYCERRDLEWNYEPYRGGLAGGPVTPYRSYELPVATTPALAIAPSSTPATGQSLSQPSTPLNQTGGGQIQYTSANLFVYSSGMADTNKSSVSRSQSSGIAPATPTPSIVSRTSGLVFEPISARLEHLLPSPQCVWSIDVSHSSGGGGGGQHRASRRQCLPATGSSSPGCVTSEVPNSSFVKRCHGCQGRGKLKCNSCHGVGYEVCLSCSGKGTTRNYSASRSYGRSYADRYSSGHDRAGDSDQFLGGGNGGGIGGGTTDANSRNSRYANGDQSSGGFGGGTGSSLGGWFNESCGTCHGAGQKRCWVCAGKSYNNCPGCAGTGQLRCFLSLRVSWLNHCEDVIINNSDQIIPKERLRVCSGLLLLDRQVDADQLRPLNIPTTTAEAANISQPSATTTDQNTEGRICRPEAEQLQLASKHLLEKHRTSYKSEKFLKQRHKVTQIECHVVGYEWKQRHGQFVIYGEERKVYIGKYPFKSFCNLI